VAKATNSAARLGGGGRADETIGGATDARGGDESFMPFV
jgi:hypothetical protein